MTNAHPPKEVSALDQRQNFSTATTDRRVDVQQAVRDIREAAATIARLSERIAACNGEVRQ